MTSAELKSALANSPFRPFRMVFGSGRVIDIPNPDLVVVSQTGRTAFAYRPASDAFDVIDILLVGSMEFTEPKSSNGGKPSHGH